MSATWRCSIDEAYEQHGATGLLVLHTVLWIGLRTISFPNQVL
jgi:hypothetical protein